MRAQVMKPLNYSLWNVAILKVISYKYLGVILSNDLCLADKVSCMVKKGWKTLHFTVCILRKGNGTHHYFIRFLNMGCCAAIHTERNGEMR
jgi:hypothetical protein